MEKEGGGNQEFFEILNKWNEGGRRFRRVKIKASPTILTKGYDGRVHIVEMTEKETRPGVWQKVYDSEKDSGPIY